MSDQQSQKFNIRGSKMLKIGEQNFEVKYPTVGELMEIENKRMLLTQDKYPEYVSARMKTLSMVFNIDLVDALSHFSVLIPGLSKKLNVDSFLEIDPITGKALVEVYKKEFVPWYEELMKAIHGHLTGEDDGDKGAQSA